nr:RNA-directed DNA polymerase, eukaryota [Tanacetum cinerariifolium]
MSKEYLVNRISKSVFVTNFSDSFGSRDLWKLCEAYEKVVDVFIPNRKSKEGKRFAFVRFIRVINLDRLIGNLCTIWVGRLHLHANAVRYEWPTKTPSPASYSSPSGYARPGSYANVVQDHHAPPKHVTHSLTNHAVVLDDSCIIDRDLSCHAMGKSRTVLQAATNDFIYDERVVWVDIEEISMHLWSQNTFLKLGSKWGEALDIEERYDASFARKRLCILTKLSYNILESFKVISKGKVYMARAKELFTWTPEFQAFKHEEVESEDESPIGDKNSHVDHQENNHGSTPHKENCTDPIPVSDHNPNVQPKVMNFSHASHINESSCGASSFRIPSAMGKGGSILDVLDGMIRKTKTDSTSHMDVKFIWGNSNYQFVCSDLAGNSGGILCVDSAGNSGGILCVWEDFIFKKDSVSVADNFIVLYGTWLPKNSKVLIVVIYAPQSPVLKRILWNYIFGLIAQWHGESIVMGDFNEVRSDEKRFSSQFNRSSASDFNNFISSAGLWRLKRKSSVKRGIMEELKAINLSLDSGVSSDDLLLKRTELNRKLYDIKQSEAYDFIQKSKVRWAIEGDENSKFFHGLINKKRSQLSIRGVFVDGDWITDPKVVKDTIRDHFASRFKRPDGSRIKLNMQFPNVLSSDQVVMLDGVITRAEIREAVWGCGVNESPGPYRFTFEFFRRFWNTIGDDFCEAVEGFFEEGYFPKGNNAAFITLIPKVTEAKFVTDFRPISLIGSVYRFVTKILANCLATQALIFKEDFAKAYDSVRWDYLLDVLQAFGFGPNWRKWIRGIFSSATASVLINGSPTSEFSFHCGLKQGDPVAPFLFILVMESLHISVSKAVNEGDFHGLRIHGSLSISHLFYDDDAIFIEEWPEDNMVNLVRILNCFYLASGLKINLSKSHVLGAGVSHEVVRHGASFIGCNVMCTPFKYLWVMVGDLITRNSAWDSIVQKVRSKLSKWKSKTLSVGGRRTLVKSVLGAAPFDHMYIYKAPKGVLNVLESIRSSLHALNRALLLKWVWRLISNDGSLWSSVIKAIHGSSFDSHSVKFSSPWCCILRELQLDSWILDSPLSVRFPRMFALEGDKHVTVADKWSDSDFKLSFRREIRVGAVREQWNDMLSILDTVSLYSSNDRWICDLNGEGMFCVQDIRKIIDVLYLPSLSDATRWVKHIPIKINVFAWRARLDCLPTRCNLLNRGVVMVSPLFPICGLFPEDVQHVVFHCEIAKSIFRRICRWWDVEWSDVSSFADWNLWFSHIR